MSAMTDEADLPKARTPRLWSVASAADLLDTNERTVWRMIRRGQLSRVRGVTGKTMVRDDELAALIEANTDRVDDAPA